MLSTMYPERLPGRVGRLALDILAVLWTVAWALIGWQVHNLVTSLEVVADGITAAGTTFNSWIQSFRDATPRNIPGLSSAFGDLANALQRSAGDPLVSRGMVAHTRIQQLAIVLGVLIALIPIAAVTGSYLVWRVRDAREIAATGAFIRAAEASGQIQQANAVLAHRAVATLPFRQLMRASSDPIRNLGEGRYDALAEAMLRRAGMNPLRSPGHPPEDSTGSGPELPD